MSMMLWVGMGMKIRVDVGMRIWIGVDMRLSAGMGMRIWVGVVQSSEASTISLICRPAFLTASQLSNLLWVSTTE